MDLRMLNRVYATSYVYIQRMLLHAIVYHHVHRLDNTLSVAES